MPLSYNPFDEAFRADPYPTYRRLRESDPVHRSPLGFWALARYEDVRGVQRDGSLAFFPPAVVEALHAAIGGGSSDAHAVVARWLLFTAGEDHRRFRGLLNPYFGPRALRKVRRLAETEVDRLLGRLPPRGTADLLDVVFRPLPVYVFCAWLGLPIEDRDRCHRWAEAIGRVVVSVPTPEMVSEMSDTVLECDGYFREKIAERRRDPGDDLLSLLLSAEHEGRPVTDDELLASVVFLLGTTYETTANMLANTVLALLRHPDQLQMLRSDPSLVATAIEELIRYDPPLQFHGRFAVGPFEVDGIEVPAGSRVVALIGAANRDPAQFPEPDDLDVLRTDVRSLSFSGGAHYCLGAGVARLEIEVALTMLLDSFDGIDAAPGDLRWRGEPLAIRGLEALPVSLG